ncbi:probable tetraacyldisaccharide 4'-kinase, mitochondrial isoform X2 [Herrania umbratica]|uniref:tetraacyldisaccharide 4'-kinase n=1 Tax=Herrania umbratica TaxID=108875 RepID=A0A6J1ANY2_9ROSI|nr:probable tetraacyldisaccharide 4'-kinase, mitochondrial isoform X2 [Herrania umbratica]
MEKLKRAVTEIAYARDQAKLSGFHRSIVPFLSLASSLYGVVLSFRRSLYRSGFFSRHRLPVPVISVGNLTWGGNGKTPMVEFIARCLSDYGISPLILTRFGLGSSTSEVNLGWFSAFGRVDQVSTIGLILAAFYFASGYAGGDEAKMLQRHLLGGPVKVGVGANRIATANLFFEKYGYVDCRGSKLFERTYLDQKVGSHISSEKIGAAILDDGMQHWSLCRDLEIVMINGLMPWGNCKLLPLGPLREPLMALKRADVAVLHHADLVLEQKLKDIELVIQEIKSLPIFYTRMAPSYFFEVRNINTKMHLGAVHNAVVLCVSAIGSSDAFVQRMEKMGPIYVDRFDFSDHHSFQTKDMHMMRERLRQLEDKFGYKPIVIVTEKDYDRDPQILKHLHPFQVLVLCSEMQIIPHKGCNKDHLKLLLRELLEVKLSGAD